jgi:hypothetical protein
MPKFVLSKMTTLMEAHRSLEFPMEYAIDTLLHWSKQHFVGVSKGTEAQWEALNLKSALDSLYSTWTH